MLIQKALSKIRLRTGDDVFLVISYESNSKLVVKIINLECKEVYVGQSNDIDLRNQAARIRLTFDEFIKKAIKALVESASDSTNFLYCLDEQDGMYAFQWKSIDEEQTIISLGSVLLKKENFVLSLTDMLEMVSVEMHVMRNKIQELNAEVEKTKIQTSDAMKQLSIATEMKERMEKEMYSKFILILNEKKRKIKELQQKNKHKPPSIFELEKKKSKYSKPLVSDSSDNTDIDEPGPSTTKNDKSLLFLEDNKCILPKNQNRIRNRKALVFKKENENKLTLKDSNESKKNITVDDDESDEFLFDNL